jgi:PAS domain S-box-containing protein
MSEHDRDNEPAGTVPAAAHGPATLEGLTVAWQQANDALHDSERRYRELVEYSLGLIYTHDLAGNILSINPAAACSLGYRPEEVVGRNLRDALAPDKRQLDGYLQRIRERGHDAGLMTVVSRSGAERVWMYGNVLTHGRAGASYVLGHAIDVSDHIAAERTLRQSERALREAHAELETRVRERTTALAEANDTLAFLAAFSDRLAPIVAFDELLDVVRRLPVPHLADWTLVHLVNDDGSLQVVPGVDAEAAAEPMLAAVAAPSGDARSLSQISAVIATGQIVITACGADDPPARLIGPTASALFRRLGPRSAAMIPLVLDGRVKAVLSLFSRRENRFAASGAIVVKDVARRIRLALDRIQLYRQAHEANRLKDEFLSTLSHELRTPLSAIFGWARILRSRELDAHTAHAVDVIERNAAAQLQLIEEVLDVSRIITGKMVLTTEPIDIGTTLRAAIDTVRPAIQAKRIRFEERLSGVPPVVGDRHRLQQVFWNLLSNAVKFTGHDGRIVATLRGADGFVEFEIEDSGIGIRRDVLPFVFDRFRQGDSSSARAHGGLGLGLAIVKHIVELHGGTVRAESAGEGRGATFTVQLPAADHAGANGTGSTDASPTDVPSKERIRGRTVLVVEDHDDARELIIGVLESAGARVIPASSTGEALQRVTSERPDVLVADIGLPVEDGYVLLSRLRARYPDVPAIALTAYARAADRERALAAGFARHIVKPVDPAALVELIGALL